MADIFVEQIVAKVETLVDGLKTTSHRVHRDLIFDLNNLPALSVMQGADTPISDLAASEFNYVTSDLQIVVSAYVSGNNSPYTTTLNAIRKEVVRAVMVNENLLLPFVLLIVPNGAGQPELSAEGESVIAKMDNFFIVRYRHSFSDPSVY